ncbi:MAG TPA: alanine--glyoxylate aminotransferase family protein [Vicinamibacteria bacterium]|nr:alanine--glyoxylate aminotransferase family protein [Vicinamibacteria bacterium]
MKNVNLRIPGPTPCPDEVLDALSRQMMDYRSAEMGTLLSGVLSKLSRYLETEREIVLLSASGTGGLEAAVTNSLSPGDRVVGVSAGVFGERFCAIANAFGAEVHRMMVEWGKVAEPDELRAMLGRVNDVRAVLLTHNETSTGIAHPIEELIEVVRSESDALVIVDAISSLGAMPLPIDALDIDLVITGSQKAWGVPPGMSLLFVSDRMFDAAEKASMPRFYFDLERYRQARERGTFPFTPTLPIVFALDRALDLMLEETREKIFARHRNVARVTRDGLKALGLPLFADERHASSTVTAFRVPEGVAEPALVERLRTSYETILARGQERLRGEILRLGHLGFVQARDVENALRALENALRDIRTL